MNPERWQKIKGLFDAAVELAPAKRGKFLKKTCGTDVELCREVEKLLASFEGAESFMESPAAAEVAGLIVENNQKLKSGQRVAHYETLRQIGEGGMGEVYLAQDTRLNRKVALKILPANLTADKSRLQRFKQEAQAASALNHPNIITIYEIREFGDTHLIATEYVEGETIRQKISGVNLKTTEILDIAAQVASALSVAHDAGVIHRDIKPENIMIRPDGIVKLLDFGLAKLAETSAAKSADVSTKKLTNPGMVMGTVNYMSPEQAQGKSVDRRTDLWSLGICLYEMLAGKTPFAGKTINHTLVAIMENQPPPLTQITKSVPAEIGQITAKLLEKKPENRYLTANDLLSDLRRLQKLIESEPNKTESGHFTTAKAELIPENTLILEETSGSVAPNNLSGQLLPLVGREKEIAEIENLLKREDVRLLTLTGIGGTGKTRLAFEIAAEMLSEFVDGVFFIPLAAVRNSEFVASEIARPLGVKDAGGKSLLKMLKDFLKEKQILLVVDNFEQVLSSATVLSELLAAAPGLKMLVTSRALLHLRVEREFVLSPLDVPSDIERLSSVDLLKCESVQLFAERAQTVKPNLTLADENLRIIAEICSRLDGLPLAIELAAARVKILSLRQILERLENSLKLLTGGARDLPAHQKTMRGAIEWSFDLLEDDEKILFRRLAVFAGGFTIESAEAVVEEEKGRRGDEEIVSDTQSVSPSPRLLVSFSQIDVLDAITSLVDKSLLVAKEQADGESRFRLLEVVREYGLERLADGGELEEMRRSHAAFFLNLATTAQPALSGAEQTKWLSILETEHDNLRAALVWSLETDAEKALRMARALWQFWFVRGYLTEGSAALREVLSRAPDLLVPVRGEALVGAGILERQRGDIGKAREFFTEARALGEKVGDANIIASALNGLGIVTAAEGDETAARAFLEEGLRVSQTAKNQRFIGLFFNSLGEHARRRGDYAEARRLYADSLAIQRELGNTRIVAIALGNLGRVSYLQNDFADARKFYAESLQINRSLGDLHSIALLLDGFAGLAADAQPERAAELLGAANALRQTVGSDFDTADADFYERIYQTVEANLEKEILAKHLSVGGALKLQQAVSLALDVNNLRQSNAGGGGAIAPFQTPSEKLNLTKSIAVLPFFTVGLKADEEYLGLGLADALITQLSQARKLAIRPTNAVRNFADAGRDALEIGKKLKTSAVLEGNLQKSGERLRVTVQLIDVESGTTLWADKFNVNFTDFFEVQDQIAEQVSKALLLELNTSEEAQLNKRFTESNAAYLEYLRGRHFWEKRDIAGFHKAVEHFKKAIDLDPTYALAYVGLSDVYCMLGIWAEYPQDEIFPRAKAAARRALEIDEKLADAHASLGRVSSVYEWDWAAAEKSYLRAIQLNPNCLNARSWLAKVYILKHQYTEAIEESRLAQKLDPLSPQAEVSLAAAHFFARRYPQAIEKYRKAVEIHPDFVPALFGLGMCLAEKGEFDEAVALQEKAVGLSKNHSMIERYLAATYAYSGNREKALEFIEKFKSLPDKSLDYSIAAVYARLNDREKAFEYLENSFAVRNRELSGLSIEPEFDNLRDEPLFNEMLRRVGLEEATEKYADFSLKNFSPTTPATISAQAETIEPQFVTKPTQLVTADDEIREL